MQIRLVNGKKCRFDENQLASSLMGSRLSSTTRGISVKAHAALRFGVAVKCGPRQFEGFRHPDRVGVPFGIGLSLMEIRRPLRLYRPPYSWRSFPIEDSHRFLGFDLFCAWQDVYLMSLMFFLSRLFVFPSLVLAGCYAWCDISAGTVMERTMLCVTPEHERAGGNGRIRFGFPVGTSAFLREVCGGSPPQKRTFPIQWKMLPVIDWARVSRARALIIDCVITPTHVV
jgi:hypothetical protein